MRPPEVVVGFPAGRNNLLIAPGDGGSRADAVKIDSAELYFEVLAFRSLR